MKKLILISMLFVGSIVYSQEISKEKQTNAEYVLELLKNPVIERVFIVPRGHHREYKKEKIEMRVEGKYLIITYNDKGHKLPLVTHRWNLEDTLLIEEYDDVVKIRLSVNIGE